MVDEICIEGYGLEDTINLAIGLRLYGCKPVLSDCSCEIRGGEGKYLIGLEGKEISICWEKDIDCTIVLNQYKRGFYLHTLNNEPKLSFLTRDKIDHRVFVGILYCLLKQGYSLREAFEKTLETLSIGGGDPFKYFRIIVEEYNSIHRLLDALDRLVKNNELLGKLLRNNIVLGVKPVENKVYLVRVHGIKPYVYVSPLERIDTRINEEYRDVEVGKSFICSEAVETPTIKELAGKIGYTIDSIEECKCLVGDDIMRLVIFLEKNL